MLYWILSLFRHVLSFYYVVLDSLTVQTVWYFFVFHFISKISRSDFGPISTFFFCFISKILILDVGPVQTEWYIFFILFL